jgi:hypothetical protein
MRQKNRISRFHESPNLCRIYTNLVEDVIGYVIIYCTYVVQYSVYVYTVLQYVQYICTYYIHHMAGCKRLESFW